MNRKPLRRVSLKRRAALAEQAVVREQVLRRAGGRCEVKVHPDCTGRADHVHHRRRRSQGGSDTPDNLLATCHTDHRWIHDHPESARALGFLRFAGDE